MVGMYDSVERYPVYPANFTPPTRASLFYAARCKVGVAIAVAMKSPEIRS